MENNKLQPIGVFDSGIGGLTAMKELLKIMPKEDIIYFGDTARVPYGSKARETIIKYAKQDLSFLLSKNTKAILIACGTVSSTSMLELQNMTDIPIVGVIEPTVRRAIELSEKKRIAVLATQATINSHAYLHHIQEMGQKTATEYKVFEKACNLFVPIVENGYVDPAHPIVKAVIAEHLTDVCDFRPDTIILGCTHYPLLREAIQSYLPFAQLVESGKEAARALAECLPEELRNNDGGDRNYYVSGGKDTFLNAYELLIGEKMKESIAIVDVEHF